MERKDPSPDKDTKKKKKKKKKKKVKKKEKGTAEGKYPALAVQKELEEIYGGNRSGSEGKGETSDLPKPRNSSPARNLRETAQRRARVPPVRLLQWRIYKASRPCSQKRPRSGL